MITAPGGYEHQLEARRGLVHLIERKSGKRHGQIRGEDAAAQQARDLGAGEIRFAHHVDERLPIERRHLDGGSRARTVAVRGTPCRIPISPKYSPADSVATSFASAPGCCLTTSTSPFGQHVEAVGGVSLADDRRAGRDIPRASIAPPPPCSRSRFRSGRRSASSVSGPRTSAAPLSMLALLDDANAELHLGAGNRIRDLLQHVAVDRKLEASSCAAARPSSS